MLDSRTIDRIFTRLLVAYAGRWLMMTSGVPDEALKTEWATVLGEVPLWRIDRALDTLDDGPNPPTPRQFRAWCMQASDNQPKPPALQDKTKPDFKRLATELGRLHELQKDRKPDQWIADLKARQRNGETLSAGQLLMLDGAKGAAGLQRGDAVTMRMTPVPHEHLPPGMRTTIKPPRMKKGLR